MKNEQQIAEKIIKELDNGLNTLEPEITQRLQIARRQAVESMPGKATTTPLAVAGWGRVVEFSHHAGTRFWLPMLLLLVLVLALLASTITAKNSTPIDADALLLASDLPPEAFADKEFVAWLENSSHL